MINFTAQTGVADKDDSHVVSQWGGNRPLFHSAITNQTNKQSKENMTAVCKTYLHLIYMENASDYFNCSYKTNDTDVWT